MISTDRLSERGRNKCKRSGDLVQLNGPLEYNHNVGKLKREKEKEKTNERSNTTFYWGEQKPDTDWHQKKPHISCHKVSPFQLLKSLGHLPNVTTRVVDYNERIPFLRQLNTTSQTDIFIGMHGAGLTHLLFLPDWAGIFEIYNCGDPGCYSDLARLRGVKYFTWPEEKIHLIRSDEEGKHPQSGEKHLKFANYHVDPIEFREQVKSMVDHVRAHPKFINSRRTQRRKQAEKEAEKQKKEL
ncbi:unnamed protein product [Caenorhabditis nigoni]